jgi:hypothetical protein
MNHLRKFNEAKSEEDIKKSIDKMAKGLEKMFGLTVSEDGIITTKNMWGKLICKLGVREGKFEKIDDKTYKSKE